MGSPGRRKYECSECTRPCSTVRPAAMSACPATWPPKTRWRSSLGWVPRKMLTSIGSRSSRLTRNSRDALMAPMFAGRAGRRHGGPARPRYPACAVAMRSGRPAPSALDVPRRVPLGCRHRRPPDRGRQRQQRLVGVGARPRLGHAGAERRRLRLVPPLARGRDLVADMGLGAYRFSLEWSRIEPAEGEFSVAALDHYRRICAACHGHGILPGRHLPPLHHRRSGWPPGAAGRRPTHPTASPAT